MDADFVCEPCEFGHGERATVVGPVTQVFRIQVVGFRAGRLDHRVQALEVGEAHVGEQHDAVERRQHSGRLGVEFACLAGAEHFGIVLVVVVQVLGEGRVFLGLLDAYVGVGAVAERLYGTGLRALAFVPVSFHKRVTCLGEFDFALDFFLHGEAELVAQAFVEGLVLFVGAAGEPVLRCDFLEFVLV